MSIKILVPKKETKNITHVFYDGVKLAVQFYSNHGNLHKVAESTGVPVARLKTWLKDDVITDEDKKALSDVMYKPKKKKGGDKDD